MKKSLFLWLVALVFVLGATGGALTARAAEDPSTDGLTPVTGMVAADSAEGAVGALATAGSDTQAVIRYKFKHFVKRQALRGRTISRSISKTSARVYFLKARNQLARWEGSFWRYTGWHTRKVYHGVKAKAGWNWITGSSWTWYSWSRNKIIFYGGARRTWRSELNPYL